MHTPANAEHDDDLLDALLERLEALAAECPTATFDELIARDELLGRRLANDRLLATRLAAQFSALRHVDRLIFPIAAERPTLPTIPGYEALEIIGHGGAGVVFRARQVSLGREVALKLMLGGRFASGRSRDRFRHEAEIAAGLQHPHIAQIFDHGEFEGLPFLSQEFIRGGTLAARIEAAPFTARGAAQLIETLARAAHYAHQCSIVHRDLKPGNVLLTESGEPKIVDFGLAKAINFDSQLTRTGESPGTPSYMAPEQVNGAAVGPHTDVYGLGTILYELLAGRPAFEGVSTGEIYGKVLSAPARFEPAVARRTPLELRAIALKCLEKNPRQRYASARDLAEDVDRWLKGLPTKAQPLSRAARAFRWARRRPAAAALIMVSVVATALLLVESISYTIQVTGALRLAEVHRHTAVHRQADVEQQKRLLLQHLYAADVPMAQKAYQRKNLAQARNLLARHEPRSGAPDQRTFDWYLLDHMCNSERLCLRGHKGDVYTATYSPNGRLLATCGQDTTVRLWDAASGRLLTTLRAHAGELNCVVFSGDGKLLASGDDEGMLRVWKVDALLANSGAAGADGQTPAAAVFLELKMPSIVWSLAFSPNSTMLAVGSDMSLDVYELEERQFIRHWEGFPGGIRAIAFTHDDTVMLSSNLEMHAGNVVSAVLTPFPLVHEHSITCLAHAHSRDLLASIDSHGVVKLWNSLTLEPIACSIPQIERVDGLDFSPDDTLLAVAGRDRTLELWDVTTQKLKGALLGHTGAIWSANFSPDGSRIAAASADGTVRVWETRSTYNWQLASAPATNYTTIAFASDSRTLAAGTADGRVEFWDWWNRELLPDQTLVTTPPTAQSISAAPQRIQGLSYLADGSLVTLNGAGHVEFWNALTRQRRELQAVLPVGSGLSSSLDGRAVIAWGDNRCARVWNLHQGAWHASEWPISSGYLGCLNSSGQSIVALTDHYQLLLVRQSDGAVEHNWRMDTEASCCLALSTDGKSAATGGSLIDRAIHIWELQSGREIASLVGHSSSVNSLVFNRDGRTLASASADGTVRLWSLHSQQELLVLPTSTIEALQLVFSPDGRALALVGHDAAGISQICIWSVKPGVLPNSNPTGAIDTTELMLDD